MGKPDTESLVTVVPFGLSQAVPNSKQKVSHKIPSRLLYVCAKWLDLFQQKWLALFLLSHKDGKPRPKDDKPINMSVVIDVRASVSH